MERRLGTVARHVCAAAPTAATGSEPAPQLRTTRLHAALGAAVEPGQIDLREPITPAMAREINRVWAEADGILVFEQQPLTEAQLKAFSANFGHVLQHPFINPNNERHSVGLERRGLVRDDGDDAEEVMTIVSRSDSWHADMTWMRHPPKATFLQCVSRDESMATGGMGGGSRGDTLFCSMTRAFEQLSRGLQASLETMTCQHAVHDLMSNMEDDQAEYPNGLGVTSLIENVHPAVIVHPLSGKKSMYVNNWPCKRFTGMTQEESAPLKRMLNEVATQQANCYRHSWAEGDLVLVDQRCTMHYVFPDYDTRTMKRVMQRTTLTDAGDAPGLYNQPRPVGVTGLTGEEMAEGGPDGLYTPRTYRENVTLLTGSYTRAGGQPFSDVEYDTSEHVFTGSAKTQRDERS